MEFLRLDYRQIEYEKDERYQVCQVLVMLEYFVQVWYNLENIDLYYIDDYVYYLD